MNKNESEQIKNVVGEYFVRVVKNHNFYHIFRKAFEKYSNHKYRLMERSQGGGYLGSIGKIYQNAHSEWQEHGRNKHDFYELITFYINQMLHLFLEAGGVDPRRLGMFGQEIFDLSCYRIYGDRFLTDMEQMNQRDGGIRTPKNDKEAWLLGQYMSLRNSGHINISFDEFIQNYEGQIDSMNFDESTYNDRREVDDNDYAEYDRDEEEDFDPFDDDNV